MYFGINILLGGVENCGPKVQKEYTLTEGNNSIEIQLCGNPQPRLSYTFRGQTEDAEMIEKLNDTKKMYKFKTNLDKIDRKDCGSTLAFNASGFDQWQANSTVLVKCINRQDNQLFLSVQTIVTKIH